MFWQTSYMIKSYMSQLHRVFLFKISVGMLLSISLQCDSQLVSHKGCKRLRLQLLNVWLHNSWWHSFVILTTMLSQYCIFISWTYAKNIPIHLILQNSLNAKFSSRNIKLKRRLWFCATAGLVRFPTHSNMHTYKRKILFHFPQFCSHRGKIDMQQIY